METVARLAVVALLVLPLVVLALRGTRWDVVRRGRTPADDDPRDADERRLRAERAALAARRGPTGGLPRADRGEVHPTGPGQPAASSPASAASASWSAASSRS